MDYNVRGYEKGDNLNDSWVNLQYQSDISDQPSLMKTFNTPNAIEKLLLEAQRESSRESSRSTSSRGSPRSLHSPHNEPIAMTVGSLSNVQEGYLLKSDLQTPIPTDWIWDWSSRPEALPPSEFTSRFIHPKRNKLSVRNTRVMQGGPFSVESLPVLLLSHACTFFLGAAAMFIYLKRYCNWSAAANPL